MLTTKGIQMSMSITLVVKTVRIVNRLVFINNTRSVNT